MTTEVSTTKKIVRDVEQAMLALKEKYTHYGYETVMWKDGKVFFRFGFTPFISSVAFRDFEAIAESVSGLPGYVYSGVETEGNLCALVICLNQKLCRD